jgi:hypothetical protein
MNGQVQQSSCCIAYSRKACVTNVFAAERGIAIIRADSSRLHDGHEACVVSSDVAKAARVPLRWFACLERSIQFW